MKIRTGFVSNSSSQSFLIRGVEITEKKLAEALGLDPTLFDEDRSIVDEPLPRSLFGQQLLSVESTRYYFDHGDYTGKVIVGKDLGKLNDGKFKKLPEPSAAVDDNIRALLKQMGIDYAAELNTYVKYISNDNY